jgi:hypothetical protein
MAAKQGNSTMHFGHDDVTKTHGEVTPPCNELKHNVNVRKWRRVDGYNDGAHVTNFGPHR